MDTARMRQNIIDTAARAHAQYPQYAGYWNGPEWKLVVVTRDVKTKMGLAFRAGDYTLARPDTAIPGDKPGAAYVTAYSVRNRINTRIKAAHVRPA